MRMLCCTNMNIGRTGMYVVTPIHGNWRGKWRCEEQDRPTWTPGAQPNSLAMGTIATAMHMRSILQRIRARAVGSTTLQNASAPQSIAPEPGDAWAAPLLNHVCASTCPCKASDTAVAFSTPFGQLTSPSWMAGIFYMGLQHHAHPR